MPYLRVSLFLDYKTNIHIKLLKLISMIIHIYSDSTKIETMIIFN